MVEKEDETAPPEMERWRRPGRQTAFRDIELVDLGAKPGCLEFLIKGGLDRIPVVAPLMMMLIHLSETHSIGRQALTTTQAEQSVQRLNANQTLQTGKQLQIANEPRTVKSTT